jgi:hypothetical protein
MSEHLREFTRHLIDEREGVPVQVATIVAVFTNLGNLIEGKTPAEQRAAARELLKEDKGLAFDEEADTFDTINEGESAEEFEARRQAGLDWPTITEIVRAPNA